MRVLSESLKARVRRRSVGTRRAYSVEKHQPVRIRHRQFLDQHRIKQTKDAGIGSDSKSKRNNNGRRKSRTLPQDARAMADIAREVENPVDAASIATLFLAL